MIPGLDVLLSGGQGGLSVATPATSSTGPVTFGGFTFAPKSSTTPPYFWIAFVAAAVFTAIVMTRRKG